MQAVQLNQILPQIQTQKTEVSHTSSPEKESSFLKSLRESIRKNDDVTEERAYVSEENQESKTEVQDKSKKKTLSDSSKNEKSEVPEITIIPVNSTKIEENQFVLSEELILEKTLKVENLKEDKKSTTLTKKQFEWLVNNNNKNVSEEVINESELKDVIQKSENLANLKTKLNDVDVAQEESVNDPINFLNNLSENIQSFSDVSDDNAFNSKNLENDFSNNKISKLKVVDLRTQNIENDNLDNVVQKSKKTEDFELQYKQDSNNSFEISVDLAKNIEQNITSSTSQAAAATNSNYQSMLSNLIQTNASDFVKASSIVLNDNDQGSINLVLHPEKLGNVKINLSLSDKLITGTITVHSQEAYDAIRESITSLKNAFAQSGFETGQFDLNFAGQQNFAQNQDSNHQNFQSNFLAEKMYGEYVSSSDIEIGSMEQDISENSNFSVNIVA